MKQYRKKITGRLFCFISVCVMCMIPLTVHSEVSDTERVLTLEEFIRLAAQNDTVFEAILIDELTLRYKKELELPARDLVLEVKAQYDFMLSQDREAPNTTVSLSKLFPMTGTEIEAEYKHTPKIATPDKTSEFTAQISQPIARNAFGKSTKLLDKIVGLEVDIARHQIIEAYEDYMATVMTAYFDWYEAYENLKVGESSYQENLKLLNNIKERYKSRIALPIDVNKTEILVFAKRETLVDLQEKYDNKLNFIQKSLRLGSNEALVPIRPALYDAMVLSFDKDYGIFKSSGRTYEVLDLLEEKSTLEVEREADDLLPSIDLFVGYTVEGQDFDIQREDNKVFGGISMEWPFPDQVDRAEYETLKISLDKTKLSTVNTHYKLYTDIKNVYQVINREKELREIAEKKVLLAQEILKDESENYTYGKASLNDYIVAVNLVDDNRFNRIAHDVRYSRFAIEWLRLTDRLVEKTVLHEEDSESK